MSKKNELHVELPTTSRKDFMVLETDEQRQSLYDPIRKEVLRTLDDGIEDYEIEVRRTEKVEEDGTRVTEEVTVRKPIRRYWMSAQEIVDEIDKTKPELGLTNYNCYYHLHKLTDQGLVEQFPSKDDAESKKRVRGMFFRTAAKFFSPMSLDISLGIVEEDLIPPQVKEKVVSLAEDVKDSGKPGVFEYDIEIDGEKHWFSVTMSLHDDGESIVSVVRNITETRAAQEALQRSQERLNLALQGADLAHWDWIEDSKIMVFSEKYAEMLGYTLEELDEFTDWYKLVHLDDVSMVRSSWDDHIAGKTPFYSAEYRLRTKAGEYKWVSDRGSIVEYDSEGEPLRAAGIIRDTTFEKLTLEALGQSEEKYQRLITQSVQGISINQNQELVFVNPAYANTLGRSIGELLDMSPSELIELFHPDDRESIIKQYEMLHEEGEFSNPLRFRYIRPNGEIRWVDTYMTLIEYDDEPAIQSLEIDVTDQYEAQQALKESEERYRSLFENLSDAVFITNPDGIIMFCNVLAGEIFGYETSEIIGRSIEDLIHPDDRNWVINTFEANTLSSDTRYEGLEARGLRKDGSTFYFQANGNALRRDGEHYGFQSLVRDITDEVESQRALRTQRDLAQMYLKMAGNIFLVLDKNGYISLLNRMGRYVLEISEDEDVIGEPWFNFVPEEERNEVRDMFGKLMQGDPDHISYRERRVVTRQGNERLIAWRTNVLYDEDREIIGLLSSGEDITERRKFEEALKESEEQYRMVVERSNIAVAITRYPPFEVLYVNKATEHTLGLAPEVYMSFSSEQLEKIVHPDDIEILRKVMTKVLEGEVGADHDSYEYRLLDNEGKIVWVRDAPQKIIYEGEPAVLSFLINITNEMNEKRMRREEIKKLKMMLNAATNGIALIGDERFRFVNDALVDLIGITRDQIEGKLVWRISPRKQPDKSSSKTKMLDILSRLHDGKVTTTEWTLRSDDGKDIHIELELTKMDWDDNVLFRISRVIDS